METRIIIGADIVPTIRNYEYFISGDVKYLIGEKLMELLDKSDFTILNLETPLTNNEHPIKKAGPCLRTPKECINGIKKINPHFFTLSNNHILDQGYEGLDDTIKCLNDNGILYAGVGRNIDEAKKGFVKEIKGIKVGIYCCAEHEFSIATSEKPGANPYDPLCSFDHVRELKRESDFIIVLYHGGKEHYRYPSPELQRIFRRFVDYGADVVVAQHTHCVGCMEQYKGGYLVYGQGNFLFDNSDSEYWKTSILLEIIISDEKKYKLSIIPCVKDKDRIRQAEMSEKEKIIEGFDKRSRDILSEGFIRDAYVKYANDMRKEYYIRLLGRIGRNPVLRIINKITQYKLLDVIYSDRYLPIIGNCFDCEAHRELVSEIMKR